jgi:hypothetical protein
MSNPNLQKQKGQTVLPINLYKYGLGIIEIPEPATILLLTLGGIALRKRKHK